ncbi:hypothetical protein CY34DRAFT_11890 [Suillus luteus UH-Slu-Lm8-n1]|uniref:Uncharacterized protein n=1 Tax=Suillus luteus UH-Slu-Lm8-n1 TaxID=930992 RepID=A0A0D0AN11_9AGAM|nr:hypothetical protein CY34DRAFT_11890 [Suillus luteus UH-Slu-Lm8-n1]
MAPPARPTLPDKGGCPTTGCMRFSSQSPLTSPQEHCITRTMTGDVCGQAWMTNHRAIQLHPPPSTQHPIMISLQTPQAIMPWQRTAQPVEPNQTANDRRRNHYEAQRPRAGATGSIFGGTGTRKAASRSTRPRQSYGSASTLPSGTSAAFNVVLLPFSILTRDNYDPFVGKCNIYPSKLASLMTQLSCFGLSLVVPVTTVNADEPVWHQITTQISSHLQSRQLVLKTPPTDLIFGNASNDISQTGLQFLVPADVPGQLLTIHYLRSVASKLENPIDANPLLLLCPTIRNISGNLPLQLALPHSRHYCLARRAMDRIGTSDLRELSEEPKCLPLCPQPWQPALFPLPSPLSTLAGLLATPPTTLAPMLVDVPMVAPGPVVTPPTPPISTNFSAFDQIETPILPDGRSLPAGAASGGQHLPSSIVGISVRGPDTEITAQGLISWTRAQMAGKIPRLPQDVAISNFNHQNIFSRDLLFNVGAGVGHGVMRTVFEHALTDMCEDAKLCRRHNDRTGYVDLNTNGIVCTPNRQADNEAFGFLAAVHLFLTGHGPHPLSPAVIIFCIAGYDGLFDLELISLLLPDYVGVLRKWPLAVPAATELFVGSDITTLGIEHLDSSPSELLDAVAKRSLTEAFYSVILFGDTGTTSSSVMTNFRHRFNIRVSATRGLCDTLRHRYRLIIPACYWRMVQTPACVISKITFASASSNIERDYTTPTPQDSLGVTYLHGVGHPDHPDLHAFMTASERNQDKNDPTLRSRLVMRFCKGSQLMPHGSDWEIKVSFIGDLPNTKAHFIPEGAPPGWKPEPLPMYAHTCTGEIDVAPNGTLVEYITDTLPPNDNGSLVTQFDIWLHSNLMRSCGGEDFTAL